MNSCIYEGWVRHRRFKPVEHSFRYRIFMMMLDLAELDEVFSVSRWWATDRAAVARFRRDDHFGEPDEPLDETVRNFVEKQSGDRPDGPIRLLTSLRCCGYVFNPVSFYYCFDRDGEQLTHLVAEVHNTPWNECHCYLLPIDSGSTSGKERSPKSSIHDTKKVFHVSPFMPMDMRYSWRLRVPAESLLVHIENRKSDQLSESKPFFDVTMRMSRREITRCSLSRLLWRYPLMTARITSAIYWQALRLWLKKIPFYKHPNKIQPATEVQ